MISNIEVERLKKEFRIAVYHEIGHTIATLIFYPQNERMLGIEIVKSQNGGYKFDTSLRSLNFKPETELHGMTMIPFAGGVFQQMIYLSQALNEDIFKFNLKERLVSVFDKYKALQLFYERNVKESAYFFP
jgi:hypothetical protein